MRIGEKIEPFVEYNPLLNMLYGLWCDEWCDDEKQTELDALKPEIDKLNTKINKALDKIDILLEE